MGRSHGPMRRALCGGGGGMGVLLSVPLRRVASAASIHRCPLPAPCPLRPLPACMHHTHTSASAPHLCRACTCVRGGYVTSQSTPQQYNSTTVLHAAWFYHVSTTTHARVQYSRTTVHQYTSTPVQYSSTTYYVVSARRRRRHQNVLRKESHASHSPKTGLRTKK